MISPPRIVYPSLLPSRCSFTVSYHLLIAIPLPSVCLRISASCSFWGTCMIYKDGFCDDWPLLNIESLSGRFLSDGVRLNRTPQRKYFMFTLYSWMDHSHPSLLIWSIISLLYSRQKCSSDKYDFVNDYIIAHSVLPSFLSFRCCI